jgi:hypothetical protein
MLHYDELRQLTRQHQLQRESEAAGQRPSASGARPTRAACSPAVAGHGAQAPVTPRRDVVSPADKRFWLTGP